MDVIERNAFYSVRVLDQLSYGDVNSRLSLLETREGWNLVGGIEVLVKVKLFKDVVELAVWTNHSVLFRQSRVVETVSYSAGLNKLTP